MTKQNRTSPGDESAATVAAEVAWRTRANSRGAVAQPPRRIFFEPFEWHAVPRKPMALDGCRMADFAGSVYDVSAGVRSVLQIIERDRVDEDSTDAGGVDIPAMLDVATSERLSRLCIASLTLLSEESERMIDFLRDHSDKRNT